MKNGILLLLVGLLVALAPSCSRKVSQAVSVSSKTDSSVVANSDNVVRETLRIDTVYVPGETTVLEILIPEGCDSLLQELNALQENSRSRVSVTKVKGKSAIRIEANCKEFEAVIVGKDIEISKLKEFVSNASSSVWTKESETFVVYRPSWFHKMFMWNAIILDILLVLYILFRVFKTYLVTQFPFLKILT